MIQITRTDEPAVMRGEVFQKERALLFAYFDSSNPAGPSQKRFDFSTKALSLVKKDLLAMSSGKCAYCESVLLSSSNGELDHFRPKGGARGLNNEYAPLHYWWLAYEWANLLIACQVCNSKHKRDLFPLEHESRRAAIGDKGPALRHEGALLIDPVQEDPAEHLEFLPDGTVLPRTKKGEATIRILGLNRIELQAQRKKAAADLGLMLEILLASVGVKGSPNAEAVIQRITALHAPNCSVEFAAVQRRVFSDWYQQHTTQWDQLSRASDAQQLDKSVLSPLVPKELISVHKQAEIKRISEQLSALKRFSIKSVEIENFKSLEKIRLQIPPVSQKESQESWLLLLGDNGIGKSSILQAIALALAGQRQLDRLQLDASDFLRQGASRGHVVVYSYEDDRPVVLTFTKDGFKTDLLDAPTFVLAYGSTRLLPKGAIQPDRNREPYVNIRNLFDYSTALTDPHNWLRRVDPKEFEERIAPAFFDLLALREQDRLQLEDGQLKLQQSGRVQKLEETSDGYKTIVGLVADIMQTLSLDHATYHNTQGIVLLDEIGNHLHPRWRLKIVGALRRAFPRLQFIVTTHEPLCLRGLSHGEVVVLVRDQAAQIRPLDHTLLPDHSAMRIDQLLTSDLFGLLNVMDEDVEKTYEEYYQLLAKTTDERTNADEAKILQLAVELNGKELLGTTPLQQAFYQSIGPAYAQLKQEGFKTTEVLKEETVVAAKAILEQQKPTWL
jgi:uncharacterized protein (TIGR02646 family)